jgi:hypothetical protein
MLLRGIGLLFFTGSLVVACGSDETSTSSFELSVEVVGEGSTSADDGVRCDGPKACDAVSVRGGSVSLRAAAKSGAELDGWTLDGAAMGKNALLYVPSKNGERHVVVARFVPAVGGSGAVDGGGAGGDGGAGTDASTRSFSCGSAGTCNDNTICCLEGAAFSTPSTKAPYCASPSSCSGRVADCLSNTDCPASSVCCFMDGDGGPSLQCVDATACGSSPGSTPLCGGGQTCAPPKNCVTINSAANVQLCVTAGET